MTHDHSGADIKALEERRVMRFEARGDMYQRDADGEWVRYRDHSNALASAIAERDAERRHAENGEELRLEERRLRQAAEARLEELTRERDEAKAVLKRITEHRMQDDTVLEALRGLSIVQEMARAFLHQGGSE